MAALASVTLAVIGMLAPTANTLLLAGLVMLITGTTSLVIKAVAEVAP